MIRYLLILVIGLLVSCSTVEKSVGKAADNASGVMSGFMDSLFTTNNRQGTVNDNNVGQRTNRAKSTTVRTRKSSTKKKATKRKPIEADDDDDEISGADRPGAF